MSANENAVAKEEFYGIDDFESQNDDVVGNDYSPKNPNPDQITNDEDDFLNSDYPEEKDEDEEDEEDGGEGDEEDDDDLDDEELEEEAENSVDKPGEDFNEPEELIEEPEEDTDEGIDDDDLETAFPEDDPRNFNHTRI